MRHIDKEKNEDRHGAAVKGVQRSTWRPIHLRGGQPSGKEVPIPLKKLTIARMW